MEEKNSKETKLKKEKRNSIVYQVVRPMVFFLICLLVIESAFLFLYYINYSVRQREESASRLAIYSFCAAVGLFFPYFISIYKALNPKRATGKHTSGTPARKPAAFSICPPPALRLPSFGT